MNQTIFALIIGIFLLFAGFVSKKKTGKTDKLSVGMGIVIILLAFHVVPFLSY